MKRHWRYAGSCRRSSRMPSRSSRLDAHQAKRWLEIRSQFFHDHESVSGCEFGRLTGIQARSGSSRSSEWKRAGRVFSVSDGSEERFPLFQLEDGHPMPVVADVLSVFGERLTPWQVAIWFVSANAWLGDWRRPVELLRTEQDRVVEAARMEVADKVL